MTDQITTPAQMREAAAKAIHNFAKSQGWHPSNVTELVTTILSLPVAEPLCTWPSCGHTAKGQCRTYTSGQLIAPNDASITATNMPVAEPEPLAVRVKPLVWEETHDDRGDGSSEHNGCYEASTALGVYEIGMGFGSDAYYWSVCDPNYNEIGSFEDPSYAKAAAEADHAARILSQIEAVSVAQVRAEALREENQRLQLAVLAAEARGLERAAVVAASDVPKDCGWGPGAGIAVRIRALITPEMRAALEQEQGK